MLNILKNIKNNYFKNYLAIKSYFKILSYSKNKIVFFSESGFYKDFFYDFVIEVNKKNNNVLYLSSDYNEYIFYKKKITTFFIGDGFIRQIIFASLDCSLLVLTLTDLGENLQISNKCSKYVYFFHSLASTHMIYKKSAFKNYNVIFCNGNYQKIELEAAEKLYSFPKKKIIETGYMYLDFIKKNYKYYDNKKYILFAPSWNYNKKNLLNEHGIFIIDFLINNQFKIIFRPHNESFKRSKEIIDIIKKKYLNHSNFFFDNEMSNLNSLKKSEIVITDNSTIGMEFSLSFYKPTIYINSTPKIHNQDYKDLQFQPLEEYFKEKLGFLININNLDEINTVYEKFKKNKKLYEKKCNEFINENLANVSNSIDTSVKNLIDIYNDVNDKK